MLKCPKCGKDLPDPDAPCACGLIYSKYEARQKRLDQGIPDPTPPSVARLISSDPDAWTRRGAFLFAGFLLIGFLWPIYSSFFLFDSSVLVWPWTITNQEKNLLEVMGTATPSDHEYMTLWVLLPLCAGVSAIILGLIPWLMVRCVGMFLTGAALLIAMLIFLFTESEILSLVYIARTWGGGAMVFAAILVSGLIAASNHLRKFHKDSLFIRIISGIASLIFGAFGVLGVIYIFSGGDGIWSIWSMALLYLAMLIYSLFGMYSAFKKSPSDTLLFLISFMTRIILCWAFLACLIGQLTANDPYIIEVIGAGGNFANIFMSEIKWFLINFGGAFMMIMGLAGILDLFLLRANKKETV